MRRIRRSCEHGQVLEIFQKFFLSPCNYALRYNNSLEHICIYRIKVKICSILFGLEGTEKYWHEHTLYKKRKKLKKIKKIKFSTKDFFRKCDQIRSFLGIWSHLLKKSLIENLIFCAVISLRNRLPV